MANELMTKPGPEIEAIRVSTWLSPRVMLLQVILGWGLAHRAERELSEFT